MKLHLSGLLACAAASIGLSLAAPAVSAADPVKINVGVIPIVDVAPIYLGVKQGYFKEQGLDVTIGSGAGGAALIPGVQGGSYEFAFSNVVSILIARDKGLDLKVVANGVSTTGSKTHDYAGIVVRGDSPIKTAKDLSGMRVSSNTLGNIADTATRAAVDKAGGNSSTIKFVELAFPSALPALENKQVDGVYLVEPFLSAALAKGNRVVSYIYADLDPKIDISYYFTSADYAKDNPAMVKKFQAAMNKSLQYAQANPSEVRAIVATYTKIPPEVLNTIVLPIWNVDIARSGFQVLAAAAHRYGAIAAEPKFESVLP